MSIEQIKINLKITKVNDIDKKYFIYACIVCLFLYLIILDIFSFSNYIRAQVNNNNNTSFIFIITSSTTTAALNNQKISFDGSIDNKEYKNAKQLPFNNSNNIDLGKLYLQYNLKNNALEGAFVIPNPSGNNDALLHLLFDTAASDNNNNNINSANLNPNNDHRIDISKNLQQARYFIGNGTNGWKVENNSIQGNNNITMKMNDPFDKINIMTSSNAEKWIGEFKIYFIQKAQKQSQTQEPLMPIKRIALLQENYLSGKKVNSSIPQNISLTDSSTWSSISLLTKNITTIQNIPSTTTVSKNQHKNPISTSIVPSLPTETNTKRPASTAIASNIINNTPITKTTPKAGTGSTNTPAAAPASQNPLLEPTVLAALITASIGAISAITVAIIANKNKNKSS